MEDDDGLMLNLAGTDLTETHVRAPKPRSNPWMRKQERREKALVRCSLTMLSHTCIVELDRGDDNLNIPQDARKKQRRDAQPQQQQPPPNKAASALKGYSLDVTPDKESREVAPREPSTTQSQAQAPQYERATRAGHPRHQEAPAENRHRKPGKQGKLCLHCCI